jgi:DNA-binding GntR family transcriptional regulator
LLLLYTDQSNGARGSCCFDTKIAANGVGVMDFTGTISGGGTRQGTSASTRFGQISVDVADASTDGLGYRPKEWLTAEFDRLDRPIALVTRIEQLLRQAIASGRFEGDRLPTEVELAKQLGVSRETVRLAAHNLQREGLLVKIRRKGTFLHPPALPDGIQSTASLALAYLQAGYPGRQGEEEAVTRLVSALMLQGALEEAAQADYQLVVLHAPYTKIGDALRRVQQNRRLRGLLFAHCGEEKLLRRAAGLGLPTVLLDHDLPRARVASVRDDSFAAALLAVRYLADLGHRRIAFVNWRRKT